MSTLLLNAENIRKTFPGVKALAGVELKVGVGEVHALLGENGAGKSTLLKILSGAQRADEGGSIVFSGAPLDPTDTPIRRQELGIVTIYQELNLLPAMSVAENMYLGREPLRTNGLIDWPRMYQDARDVLESLGLGEIDPKTITRSLSVAEQQMVEISKALTMKAKLIIMDEPTSTLSGKEVDKLHTIVRDLKNKGISIVYVTHRLIEVKAVCDRYTVFRDGKYMATGNVADVTLEDIVRMMVGRNVEFVRRESAAQVGETVLQVSGITRPVSPTDPHATPLLDMSLEARAGEILGFAGLVGSGRTELARVIYGADPCAAGTITLDGKTRRPFSSPTEALAAGIALVPEDRKQQGCFLVHSIRQNIALPNLSRLKKWEFFIDEKAETAMIEDFRKKLSIKMSHDSVAIGTLSGGNQQKVLLARFLALKPRVLIVDEPTRGIDIGAKAEVHQVLFDLARAGIAVIVISSELPEVMAISDRIITFREGQITGEIAGKDATEEKLMRLMAIGSGGQQSNAHAA